MRKAVWSLVVLFLLAGGFLALVLWLGAEGPVSPAGFRRLQPGMTRDDVQAILAVEPSSNGWLKLWPGTKEPRLLEGFGSVGLRWANPNWAYWESRDYLICVYFSDNGRVDAANIYQFQETSLWQNVRRWLTGG